MALTSGPVVVKRADTTPASRTLAYEQQINRDEASAPAPEENAPEQQAAAPVEQPTAPTESESGRRLRRPAPPRTIRKWRRCRIAAR